MKGDDLQIYSFSSTQQRQMIIASLTSLQALLNYMDQMEESGFNIYEV